MKEYWREKYRYENNERSILTWKQISRTWDTCLTGYSKEGDKAGYICAHDDCELSAAKESPGNPDFKNNHLRSKNI